MRNFLALCLTCVILQPIYALAAVLIEENGRPVNEVTTQSNVVGGYEFRRQRKVGVGVAGAGVWGAIGTHLDLNFSSEYSLHTGVGVGEGYRTFALQIRKYISGNSFLPYVSGGIGRWYTAGEGGSNIEKSSPGFLAKRFLNNKEKQTGQFSELFLFPSLGIQYLQLSGEWAGSAVFAEINVLIDLDDFIMAPTGSLGYTFFF